jgi:agmatine deiminase
MRTITHRLGSTRSFSVLGTALAGAAAFNAVLPIASAQIWGPGNELIYPQDAAIPKSLTDVERKYMEQFPITGQLGRGVTAPPTGPIRTATEHGPTEAIMMSWRGLTSWQTIQGQIARHVTNAGNADVIMVIPSVSFQSQVHSVLQTNGADMSRVKYLVRNTDTIWIRDYGARFIYEGNVRAITDHQYNRPRFADNALPGFVAQTRGHPFYEMGIGTTQLIHGGGNYHLDGIGRGWATQLIVNENPSFTAQQIIGIYQDYQNLDTTITAAFPTSVDSTQHIDMWMQIVDDDRVVISTWPNNPGSIQAQICDTTAAQMQGLGYQVFRTPALSVGGHHYTYTNVVVCNDVVIIPIFTNATVAPHNATAFSVWQQAAPGKTIAQVNCDTLVTSAGVMHCIVKHVPAHLGGENPTAYLRGPRGGEILASGQPYTISWISDDDVAVTSVELRLSTDGGATFPTLIAGNLPRLGTYSWTVPEIDTLRARVRIIARDADNNTGYDQSETNFTIGEPCYANCNESTGTPLLSIDDFICFINEFAAAQSLPHEEQVGHYANCDGSTAPPVLGVDDFICFVNEFAAGCP